MAGMPMKRQATPGPKSTTPSSPGGGLPGVPGLGGSSGSSAPPTYGAPGGAAGGHSHGS
jgi:hypothetical protein